MGVESIEGVKEVSLRKCYLCEDLKETRGWALWVPREEVSGRGNRKYKGSETRGSLEVSRNRKEIRLAAVESVRGWALFQRLHLFQSTNFLRGFLSNLFLGLLYRPCIYFELGYSKTWIEFKLIHASWNERTDLLILIYLKLLLSNNILCY